MRSCLHTYRTKTNLTQHIIQPWGGGRGASGNMGRGVINQLWGGHQPSMGGHQPSMGRGVINQLWGGHQPNMGGSSTKYGWGGSSTNYGGAISQVWGGHQPSMGRGVINQLWVEGSSTNYGGWYHHVAMGDGVSIFPPVCTGTQNPENYFSNTYVLPSVNRTAGPMRVSLEGPRKKAIIMRIPFITAYSFRSPGPGGWWCLGLSVYFIFAW